jgi:ferrous iron transport protein B
MPDKITIAMAGNPNAGKTTLFNALTGSHQSVGNWPGVTVEKKEGIANYKGHKIRVVDLPGVYSLTAYSPDEIISRNFIINDSPDVVVNIVDASNLDRNLYLTIQTLEMGVPSIIVLNMMDVAEKSGQKIDVAALSAEIGAPVIPLVASKGQGVKNLLEMVISLAEKKTTPDFRLNYGEELENEISRLESILFDLPGGTGNLPRWTAIKLLEQDKDVTARFDDGQLQNATAKSLKHLKNMRGDQAETLIADARYGFISGLLRDVLQRPAAEPRSISDKIDSVLVNRWLGIPIFLLIMLGMFEFIFTLSSPLTDLISRFFEWIGELATGISPAWLGSLLGNGVLGGVGTLLSFIPPIFMLFIAISILEDCGYMARAAFVMDKIMHKIGLHGRSFIPMALSLGCNISGIMACRTIENPRDRLTTMLVTPFMSCGARLTIYVLLAAAFFPSQQGLVVFSLYVLGIITALLAAFVLRKKVFSGESSHFVMELPPYRLPTVTGVLVHMWQRGKSFIVKAGTVILGLVLVVWFLSSMPWGVEYASAESWMGHIGRFIAPVLSPAGFGQWQAAVSLVFGFLAKEVVVGTMGAIFGVASGSLGQTIAAQLGWTPLTAYSFMVFCLLYLPCVASINTIRTEAGSWKWALFTAVYTTLIAWVASTLIYQIGSLFVG